MTTLDWIAFVLFVAASIDCIFIAHQVRKIDARELASERLRETPPFPYREALGFDRHDQTRRTA